MSSAETVSALVVFVSMFFGFVVLITVLTGAVYVLKRLLGLNKPETIEGYPEETRTVLPQKVFFSQFKTHGKPGIKLYSSDLGSSIYAGVRGEQKTAEIMNAVLKNHPTAVAFHSVSWWRNIKADIDHVVVVGSHVLYIDSKQWAAAQYDVNKRGHILKNGQEWSAQSPGFIKGADQYKKKFSRIKPSHVIVIHTKGSLTVQPGRFPYDVLQSQDFERYLEEWVSKAEKYYRKPQYDILHAFYTHTIPKKFQYVLEWAKSKEVVAEEITEVEDKETTS